MIGYSAIYTLAPVTQRDELQMVGAFVIGTISILAFASLTRLFYECSPFRFVILGVMIGYSAIYTITHVHLRYEFPIFWLNALLAMGCIDHLCIARDVAHGNRT
jgi:hypothetical protein